MIKKKMKLVGSGEFAKLGKQPSEIHRQLVDSGLRAQKQPLSPFLPPLRVVRRLPLCPRDTFFTLLKIDALILLQKL